MDNKHTDIKNYNVIKVLVVRSLKYLITEELVSGVIDGNRCHMEEVHKAQRRGYYSSQVREDPDKEENTSLYHFSQLFAEN